SGTLGTHVITFTANTTSTRLRIYRNDATAQGNLTFYVNSVRLVELSDAPLAAYISANAANAYRYGFNGMERDDEWKGTGNAYDFGARIYDARLGRWLARDPLEAKYSDLSPYNFGANNPVHFVDPDGERIIAGNQLAKEQLQLHLNDQFGNGVFKVKRNGEVKTRRFKYNRLMNSLDNDDVKRELLRKVDRVVGNNKTVTYYAFQDGGDKSLIWYRNPTKTEAYIDKTTGNTMFRQVPIYTVDGTPTGRPGRKFGSFSDEAYTQTDLGGPYIVQSVEDSEVGTFEGEQEVTTYEVVLNEYGEPANGGDWSDPKEVNTNTTVQEAKTEPCASCIFLHELLDHVLEEDINGKSTDRPKNEQVNHHNKAIKNKGGSIFRNGKDHGGT
ncbi:MAG: RHS repeat-associated core domain-containing protein, partial [Bacteroidia bacterium]